MRNYLLILLMLSSIYGYSQKKSQKEPIKTGKIIARINQGEYLDSLKTSLLLDTADFSRSDLIHTSIGTFSKKSNSPVFVINGKYRYKLDIINGKGVLEFVEKVLNYKAIKEITEVYPKYSQALYGSFGEHGAILITFKKSVKFDPHIAGLTLQGKNQGNNFDQRQPGEIMLRH